MAVVQLGARMHYAVPRLFAEVGALSIFHTDLCAHTWGFERVISAISPLVSVPRKLKKLADRQVRGVPRALVKSHVAVGLSYGVRLACVRTPTDLTRTHLWAGNAIGDAVGTSGLGTADAVYAFNSAALRVFEHAERKGMRKVLEQTIAPYSLERRMLREEDRRWSQWQPTMSDELEEAFVERERQEWEAASCIVCGSDFVREGIREAGGPADKCFVVPYGVDGLGPGSTPEMRRPSGPLKVLFAGTVGLRKGIQYLCAAADLLPRSAVHIRAVGPISLSANAQREVRKRIDLAGPIPRSAIAREMLSADVFVLPTLFEGSATVCYEAMAYGKPVITTPNAGSTVRDGVDGFLVPPRDPEALADRLERCAADHDLVCEMGTNAMRRAAEFTVASYGGRLRAVLQGAGCMTTPENGG